MAMAQSNATPAPEKMEAAQNANIAGLRSAETAMAKDISAPRCMHRAVSRCREPWEGSLMLREAPLLPAVPSWKSGEAKDELVSPGSYSYVPTFALFQKLSAI